MGQVLQGAISSSRQSIERRRPMAKRGKKEREGAEIGQLARVSKRDVERGSDHEVGEEDDPSSATIVFP